MPAEPTILNRTTQLLSDPRTYRDGSARVDVVETHISRVFLTERFAYKLKKPVRFEFLDFSTVERRESACRDELRLNRRMARDVYLDVRPITAFPDGRLALGPDEGGAPYVVVDWVVVMRRLPADRMLDELLRNGRLAEADASRTIEYLASYYARAEPIKVSPEPLGESCLAHVRANFDDLLRTEPDEEPRIRRIHTPQLQMLQALPDWLEARVRAGRVIEGHGDLRPEHVCLVDPPAVFDCLEFNADLRRVDVLDELCFLAMECDRLGAHEFGDRCLAAYRRRAADDAPDELIAFYKAYRASVRAKVAALRARQLAGSDGDVGHRTCREYLTLADAYLRDAGARPSLVVVCGLMGSGKSTLAREVAQGLGAVLLRTDVVRNELLPTTGAVESFGAGRYASEARRRVYDATLARAETLLTSGVSVVLDGTYSQTEVRRGAIAAGRALGATTLLVHCTCSREASLERIRRRREQAEPDASEARPDLYDRQAAEWEAGAELSESYAADTTQGSQAHTAAIYRRLGSPFG